MILYLDASAIVKRYVAEAGSKDIIALVDDAGVVATSMISRAEVAAAFARAVRLGVLDDAGGRRAQRRFAREWPDFVRILVTEALVSRADALAWSHGLRGYDAVQLASSMTWQDAIGQDVVLATFDQQLTKAGSDAGLRVWPEERELNRARPTR
ncbi:MAG: type II toxin-antitoxin system VapC family toxin [Acidobacteria bacterium]|nr:type II toxin-antitoxin system VapC family toxin [Acidobacteriota bacterium]